MEHDDTQSIIQVLFSELSKRGFDRFGHLMLTLSIPASLIWKLTDAFIEDIQLLMASKVSCEYNWHDKDYWKHIWKKYCSVDVRQHSPPLLSKHQIRE